MSAYTFEGPTPATDGEFGAYADDDVWDAQYLETATVHAGEQIRNPAHYAEVADHDLDPDVARFATWRVLVGGTHVFDVWVVNVDGAVVFEAGCKTRAPINVIQGGWEANGDAGWEAICAELAAAAPESLWF